ncbi:hypothetical protein SD1617_1366 [Shigella dysenteriae 1617]|uniref:Uncharacterized protein n=4 Tax=root TaxID=1 RepID=Q32DG3_SHIDS|nr:conserved hypothetical protein [Shigella dysenteriae Sd197]AHA66301.1 hypothetical protein Asd1617_03474 [Shigella dysenteriae 1617]ESU81253.1 hypothetical protein WRSd3_00859 [Shigella dysenteriae WRSd3]ESU83655.1 hypothetical protein WRSd5_01550 [Shigella dysenteriae WRSd5]PQN15595.1 hypothetical protein C5K22_13830 [Shigella dysenteriae]
MTSRLFLRKNHNFKRGLKDKWCISNASLDNALLVSKFIEIIMLIKWVVIFLLAQINFLFLKQSSSFNVINKNVLKRWTDRN